MYSEIGVGTVGYGVIAKTHLIAMQCNRLLHSDQPYAVPRALCTRRPQRGVGLPYESVYADPMQLIADEGVQVVDICTPNYLHPEVAAAALKAGKGVYLEKPMASRLEDARALCLLAEETGLVNQTALVLRFRPTVNRVKDLLCAGIIGDVIHFRCCFYHGSYLDPNRPTSWRQQMDKSGGGAVMDLGIHLLDMVRYLLGEVADVKARSRTVFPQRYTDNTQTDTVPNDTDEYTCAMLTMESGAVGLMESSRVSTSAEANEVFEVFGTAGSLYLDFDGPGCVKLTTSDGRGTIRLSGNKPGPREKEIRAILPGLRQSLSPFVDAHAAAIQNLCNWYAGSEVFSGTPTFADGYKAQMLVEQCMRSAAQNHDT